MKCKGLYFSVAAAFNKTFVIHFVHGCVVYFCVSFQVIWSICFMVTSFITPDTEHLDLDLSTLDCCLCVFATSRNTQNEEDKVVVCQHTTLQ